MSNLEFKCQKCEQNAIPIKIEHFSKKDIYEITLKCPNHISKIKASEDDVDNKLGDIFNSTLRCIHCGATHPDIQELDHCPKFTWGGKHDFVSFQKVCSKCGKKSEYELDILLYNRLYDNYFKFLKSQNTPELIQKYQEILKCKECGNKIIPRLVGTKEGEATLEGKCSGSKKHKILIKLPLKDQYSWLGLFLDTINVCKRCGSTDLRPFKLDFKINFKKRAYVDWRSIVDKCKNCGNENVTQMQQGLFEIYNRLLKEKKSTQIEGKALLCSKCDAEILLEQAILKPKEIQAIIYCKNKHKKNIKLPLDEKEKWISSLLSGAKICKKCWSKNQKVSEIKLEPEGMNKFKETTINFRCLDCDNKRKIKINNVLFDDFIEILT